MSKNQNKVEKSTKKKVENTVVHKKFNGRIFAIIGLSILATAFIAIAIILAVNGLDGGNPPPSSNDGWTQNY